MLAPDSDETAPIIVDALTLARQGAAYEHQFRHRRFSRLSGLAVSDQPMIDIALQFSLRRGVPAISGKLQGKVELVCQRCMNAMQQSIDEKVELLVVDTDVVLVSDKPEDIDEALLQSEQDEWIADATHLDVVALVEEQILLALPLVAKHEDERQCVKVAETLIPQARRDKVDTDRPADFTTDANEDLVRRPFANLRELLKK